MSFHKIIIDYRNSLAKAEDLGQLGMDTEQFYQKINKLDFRFNFFSPYYRKYIANLNRFKPEAENSELNLSFLKIAIAEGKYKPTKPFPIFVHHLKYKFRFTSRFFISQQKKKNLKKLNPTVEFGKEKSKFDTSKNWTRIPIRQDKCKQDCGCSK